MKQLFAFFAIILLCGCQDKSSNTRLAETLGDFQYAGLVPKLSVKILKRELVVPQNEHGTYKLNLTGVIQQEGEFPVKQYMARIALAAHLGEQRFNGLADVLVTDGSAAFSDEVWLFDLPPNSKPTAESFKIKVVSFEWTPIVKWSGKITLTE